MTLLALWVTLLAGFFAGWVARSLQAKNDRHCFNPNHRR